MIQLTGGGLKIAVLELLISWVVLMIPGIGLMIP
jgi:hypothetical protein